MPSLIQRLVDTFDEFVGSEEWGVNPDDSHFKFYKWWLNHGGGNDFGYRENFCHYWRVVLGHVPLTWFFLIPFWWQIRLWMILAPIVGIQLYRVDDPSWLPAVALSCLFAVAQLQNSAKVSQISYWFFSAKKFYIIRPITVLFAAYAVFAGIRTGDTRVSVIVLVAEMLCLFGLALLGAMVGIGFDIWDFLHWRYIDLQLGNRRRREHLETAPQSPRRGFLSLIIHAAAAKKRKICPYVRFPEGFDPGSTI